MKKLILISVMAIGTAAVFPMNHAVAGPTTQQTDDGKLKLEDCPKPVQATLNKEVGSGKIQSLTKQTKGGKTTYEADAHIDGKNYDIVVAEDGKLVSMDQE